MIVWGAGWRYMFWEAASERIQYVFRNYPGGGSPGVLLYVNQVGDGTMKKVGAAVVEGHPDLGMQVAIYWVEILSADKSRINEFGLWDHRFPLADGPGSSAEKLDNITFPINFPFHGNPAFVNVYNATSGELVASMDVRYELYGWCSVHEWEGEDCQELDIDGNGVPDYQETEGWNPSERIEDVEFGDRPDLEMPKEDPPQEESFADEVAEESEATKPQPTRTEASAGTELTWIIIILVLVVVILSVFLLLKKRPKGIKAKQGREKVCSNCGKPMVEEADSFCASCGDKQ
jgi:hypothetical protein